jgi:hypothetical protein
LGKEAAIGRVEPRRYRRLVVGQLLVIGQAMAEVPEQTGNRGGANDQGGGREGQQDFE